MKKEKMLMIGEENIETLREFILGEIGTMKAYFKLAVETDANEYARKCYNICEMAEENAKRIKNPEVFTHYLDIFTQDGLFEKRVNFGTCLVSALSNPCVMASDSNLTAMHEAEVQDAVEEAEPDVEDEGNKA